MKNNISQSPITLLDKNETNIYSFSLPNDLVVTEAPIHWGQKKPGVALGAKALLPSSSSNEIHSHNLNFQNPLLNSEPYKALYEKILKQTLTKKQEKWPLKHLVLGGDHSLSLASIFALKKIYPRLKVLWIDAHGDINTPASSPTGNFHGMPAAALLGLFQLQKYKSWEWYHPCLLPEDIIYMGVRDLDPAEEEHLKKLNIKVFTMKELRHKDLFRATLEIVKYLDPTQTCPLHISFDIDSVDPNFAPCTGVPVNNGFNPSQITAIAKALSLTNQVKSIDLVEINPECADSNGLQETLNCAQNFLNEILNED